MRVFAAALLAAVLVVAVPSSAVGETWKQWDRARINYLRAERHVPPLSYRLVLQSEAQAWANRMAARDRVVQNIRTGPCFNMASSHVFGDNAAVGPTVPSVQHYFERSRSHFANMVDRSFRFIGIGVARGFGWVWVDQVFCG